MGEGERLGREIEDAIKKTLSGEFRKRVNFTPKGPAQMVDSSSDGLKGMLVSFDEMREVIITDISGGLGVPPKTAKVIIEHQGPFLSGNPPIYAMAVYGTNETPDVEQFGDDCEKFGSVEGALRGAALDLLK